MFYVSQCKSTTITMLVSSTRRIELSIVLAVRVARIAVIIPAVFVKRTILQVKDRVVPAAER